MWGATRGRVGSRRGITRSARCRRPRRSCAGRPCPPSSARRGSRWRGGGGGGAGGGRGRVEVEGGAVRSGGTSGGGAARAAPPRAHKAALHERRGLGPPPHPPRPVVLHVGGEQRTFELLVCSPVLSLRTGLYVSRYFWEVCPPLNVSGHSCERHTLARVSQRLAASSGNFLRTGLALILGF